MIHCKVTQTSSQQQFYVSFVYGANSIAGRIPLWQDLEHTFQAIQGPWCVVGDFNSILHPKERMGGEEVHYAEIKDFNQRLKDCDLYEINTSRVFFIWTNKIVWSKINRVLVNSLWHQSMGSTHV